MVAGWCSASRLSSPDRDHHTFSHTAKPLQPDSNGPMRSASARAAKPSWELRPRSSWRTYHNAIRRHRSPGYRPPAPEAILPPKSGLSGRGRRAARRASLTGSFPRPLIAIAGPDHQADIQLAEADGILVIFLLFADRAHRARRLREIFKCILQSGSLRQPP